MPFEALSMCKGFFFSGLLLLSACQFPNDSPKENEKQFTPDQFQQAREGQIQRNREFLKQERESIEQYIADRNWEMMRTGNGLYYRIDSITGKEKPAFKSEVQLKMQAYLLDGTVIHPNDSLTIRVAVGTDTRFVIGFHEGLQLMEEGTTAKFILPSHLAHGLAGDLENIPPMSALVYEVDLIKIIN